MSKFQVKSTRRDDAPVRVVIHGPGGVGKSTFAASAPDPIFIAAESGLDRINAQAVDPYPDTYEDVLGALDHIATLNFRTVVLDSLDWIEPLVWDYTVRQGKASKVKGASAWKNIEDVGGGFQKGYIAALDHWRILTKKLELLRVKGMNVILIAHSVRKTVKNPLGDDYEQMTIKLHEKAAGLISENVDVIGFCELDVSSTEETSGRFKAQTTGHRIIRTNPNPAYLAKTRFDAMPARIVLPRERGWEAFAKTMQIDDGANVIELTQRLEERIRELADAEVEKKIRDYVKANDATAPALTEAIRRTDETITERRKAS